MSVTKRDSSLKWSSFSQAEDLKTRIVFTFLALIVYRIGAFVPLPGVDSSVLTELTSKSAGGILGMLDMFSGGALSRMTIFALNMTPYISASILITVLSVMLPPLAALRKEGFSGRRLLNKYTRYLTIIIAIAQSTTLCVGMNAYKDGLVTIGTGLFTLIGVVTLTGGSLFLMWLGEQITKRGIGNGSSILVFAGIVANLPNAMINAIKIGRSGAVSYGTLLFVVITVFAMICLVVFFERAYRNIKVYYSKGAAFSASGKISDSTYLPIKLNSAGVMPPMFASSLLLLPITVVNFAGNKFPILHSVSLYLAHGKPLYIAIYICLLVLVAFVYTEIVINTEDIADNLKKSGAVLYGIRPGEKTAAYIGAIVNRLTTMGAAYLICVCILPEIVLSYLSLPFFFTGSNIIIVVGVALETISKIQTHLSTYQYGGVLKT